MNKKSDKELLDDAESIRLGRDGVVLELSKNNIRKWQIMSKDDAFKRIGNQFNYLAKKPN